jgi:uncharacterized protein involved in oxidation of intracellular sulfur
MQPAAETRLLRKTPQENLMPERKDKIVIFVTHGGENPEMATIPFVMANAARAMETEVVVVLQGPAVSLAKKGCYEHVFAAGLSSLKDQVDTFIKSGGAILVCTPCIKERKITNEMLVESAQPVASGRVITEVLDAAAVLNY